MGREEEGISVVWVGIRTGILGNNPLSPSKSIRKQTKKKQNQEQCAR